MNPQADPENGWEAWQEGWQAAQIGSLSLIRTLALPAPAAPPEDDSEQWRLTLGLVANDIVTIVSEISRFADRFYVSVATQAAIRFHPNQRLAVEPMNDETADALLHAYGPWISHALWDFSRPFFLQATSGLPLQRPINVPAKTPQPTLMTKARLKEQAMERQIRAQQSEDAGCDNSSETQHTA